MAFAGAIWSFFSLRSSSNHSGVTYIAWTWLQSGAFKAGDRNAHHLQNRSDEPAVFFDVGGRDPWDVSTFPEMGLEARTHMQIEFRPMRK